MINLSLGGPADDPALDRAIDYATAKGALVVASAGNSGNTPATRSTIRRRTSGPTGSGGWSIGLSVGATTPAGQPAYFSTHNLFVSMAAPGAGPSQADCAHGDFSTLPVSTNTTEWDDASDPCNNVSQPDMARRGERAAGPMARARASRPRSSPEVAALVRQANPLLTPSQVADVIRRTATQTLGTGWNPYTGAGIVNANAAVAVARDVRHHAADLGCSTAVPKVGGIQADVTAIDVVDAGKTVAGAVVADARGRHVTASPGARPCRRPAPASASADPDLGPVWLRSRSATPTTTAPSRSRARSRR